MTDGPSPGAGKGYVCVGLKEGQEEEVEKVDGKWRVDGKWAVVQYCAKEQ